MPKKTKYARIGVSLREEDLEQLRKIADAETRNLSEQLVYMMKVYIKNKKD